MGPVLAEGRVGAPRARWNDLITRVLSAAVLLPVALYCIWSGGVFFNALIGVGCVVLALEWSGMCGIDPGSPRMFWLPALIAGVAAATIFHSALLALSLLLAGSVLTAVLSGAWTTHAPSPRGAGRGVGGQAGRLNLAFGVPYLGMAAVALLWLRADPVAGWPNTIFILCIVWGSDIGAYMIGRLCGGPKLAPSVSPGKTWSGAAGGLAAAALAGIAVAACFSAGFSPSHVAELAVGLGIVSQAGDLLESALKRHFGVKDSGRIIPGHGGLLDRVDAVLAVAPVAAVLAFSVGRGVVLWR